MSDFVPTTEMVKYAYVGFQDSGSAQSRNYAKDKFDNWLKKHDAEIRKEVMLSAQSQITEALAVGMQFDPGARTTLAMIDILSRKDESYE